MYYQYVGFLDNDDFPTLNPGEEKPENEKKEEETKETLYGPGPSLRPQSKFIRVNIYYLMCLMLTQSFK